MFSASFPKALQVTKLNQAQVTKVLIDLKQRITALEDGSPRLASQIDRQDKSAIERILLNYTWKELIPLAKGSPEELTLFKEYEPLGNFTEWILATLGTGTYTKKGDKIRYPCWDGSKVIWLHYTGINPFNVQPAAVYKFTISEAVKIPAKNHNNYPYHYAVVSVGPVFVKNLLDGEHTPLRPQVYRKN